MNTKFYNNLSLCLSVLLIVLNSGAGYAKSAVSANQFQPANISSISAERNRDRTVSVTWVNENENGVTRYELERSADGTKFSLVESISYVTNDGQKNDYSALDWNGLETAAYYRVKAVSLNGSHAYSAVVRVELLKKATPVTVFPNPLIGKSLQVHFGNQPEGKYSLYLYNSMGQLVWHTDTDVQFTVEEKSFFLGKVSTGSYHLVTVSKGEKDIQQVIIN